MMTVTEILSYMPASFQQAYKEKKYAKYEETEAGDWVPEWCEECEAWHKYAYSIDYITDDGILYGALMEVDADGDWNMLDMTEVGTAEFDQLMRDAIPSSSNFEAYNKHVAETGTDPLDLYFTKDPEKLRRLAKGE